MKHRTTPRPLRIQNYESAKIKISDRSELSPNQFSKSRTWADQDQTIEKLGPDQEQLKIENFDSDRTWTKPILRISDRKMLKISDLFGPAVLGTRGPLITGQTLFQVFPSETFSFISFNWNKNWLIIKFRFRFYFRLSNSGVGWLPTADKRINKHIWNWTNDICRTDLLSLIKNICNRLALSVS